MDYITIRKNLTRVQSQLECKPKPLTSQMSTLSLAAHTVVFSGATLEELHDQICKYAVKVGLADTVEEVTAAVAAPVAAPKPEFFGVDGSLLGMKPVDFGNWASTITTPNHADIQRCYYVIQEALTTMPPFLAAKALELAAKNSYGAPTHLVAEYHYNRWMLEQEETVTTRLYMLKSLVPKDQNLYKQIELMVDHSLLKGTFFSDRLFALAVKLVKEHGWKGPTNYSLAGTEFQKVAMDASKVKLDGRSVPTSGHGSLNTHMLDKALKAH